MASMIGVLVLQLAKPDVTKDSVCCIQLQVVHNRCFWPFVYIYFVKWLKARFWVSLMGVLVVALLAVLSQRIHFFHSPWGSLFLFTQGKPLLLRRRNGSCYLDITLLILPLLFVECLLQVSPRHASTDNGIIPNHGSPDCGGNSLFAIFWHRWLGVHVFCNTTEYPSYRPPWFRYGEGPGPRSTPCGPCIVTTSMIVIRSILGRKNLLSSSVSL